MRDRITHLHNLGFLAALLLLAVLGLQGVRTQQALLRADASVRGSLELITVLQATLSALQDVETGMRGYVITGERRFLQPYVQGRSDIDRARRDLQRLVADDPDDAHWLRQTQAAIDRRLQLAALTVAAYEREGPAAAAERVRSGGGKQAMDAVRTLLGRREAAERAHLAADRLRVQAQADRTERFGIAGGLFAISLLLAAMYAVNRSLRLHAQSLGQARAATARQVAIVQAVPDALWQLDADGSLRPLSSGRGPLPGAVERELRDLLPRLDDRTVQAFEARAEGRDYEVRALATGDGHLAIVRDITEASRTRRALDAQRTFLRTIVDTDANLISVRDPEGRFALCNVAYCDLLQLDPAQMEGRHPDALARHAVIAPLLDGDAAVLAGGDEWRADRVQVTDAQGVVRCLQLLKRPVERADGARQVLTVAVDITARLRAEQMKNEFVSTVSHELRTPLTSIRGALSMVTSGMAGDVPESARPLLDIASKNTERLVRLINDILDIEKLESGRLQLQTRTLAARPLVLQAVEQIGPYAREFDVELQVRGEDDARVDVDPDRFAQVMANLLSNAIKHSPRGAVVDVELARRDEGLEIAVQDRGGGIPEAFQPRVFERFAQADASDARLRGGTGLGLAITRSLVEQMGGGIGFTSSAQAGTRFRVWLPEAAPAPGPVAGDAQPGAPAERIVLLDDDAATARELAGMLERHGYRVDVAADTAQARAMLESDGVRGVAIDVALAGEAGPAFVRELRAQSRFRHLPALLIGLQEAETPGLRGGAVGVVDWLSKPLEPARVAEAVRACLRGGTRGCPDVLHVEDDADVRELLAGLLAREPLRLHQAATLAEARAQLAARPHDLVILDLMLPDGDGAELLPELGAARPPVPAIIFSAQDMQVPESGVVLRRLVKSRSDARELAALISENLRHWPMPGPRHEDAP